MAEKGIRQRLAWFARLRPAELLEDRFLEDLTSRIRRPNRWMLRHPLRAARRRRRLALTVALIGVLATALASQQRREKRPGPGA